MNRKQKHKQPVVLSKKTLRKKYGLEDSIIDKYFPPAFERTRRVNDKIKVIPFWNNAEVKKRLQAPEVQKAIERLEQEREEKLQREDRLRELMMSYDPQRFLAQARMLDRRFVLHEGPTNSGKTYDSIQALMKADTGVYLGPLRLLALEMFDKLNAAGVRCNLLTGEEAIEVPGADITASTIELCDYSKHYDVAVIDEAQMLADPSRGANWTKAILLVNAAEVHVCMAPQALELISGLLTDLEVPFEVHHHDRLVPLEFAGTWKGLKDVENGDAIITFSRKNVLNIAAHLEQQKIPTSVIYGDLPPAARREEVRRFAEKETKVVVATDAIGMGISLPIRRIIFYETQKFDGERRRPLRAHEVQQIAGRAGRFGMYDLGEVLSFEDAHGIRIAMEAELNPLRSIRIPFPRDTLQADFDLEELLRSWRLLPRNHTFEREDLTDAEFLLSFFRKQSRRHVPNDQMFDLVSCPVDTKNENLVMYWFRCAKKILDGNTIPIPYFNTNSLESCELQYHAYDIYSQLSRRCGIIVRCEEEKDDLCKKINAFLKSSKKDFLRKCKYCGKVMPFQSTFGICEACYALYEW